MISFIQSVDARVLESLYAVRDPSVVQSMIWVSELGTVFTIYGVALCIGLVLLLYRKYAAAAGLTVAATASGIGIVLGKGLIERARPSVSFRAYTELWYSFPSAHAALSAALYGYGIFLVWSLVPSRNMRIFATVVLSLLVVGISFSRIYLGVHYVSDIIAGILLGAFCAWLGYRWLAFARTS